MTTITTLDGKKHEMKKIAGRHWRILSEFIDNAPEYTDPAFLEKHAEFIAFFFEDLTSEDILDLPLEEILPVSVAIRQLIMERLTEKMAKIEKNASADKAQ